MLRALVPALLFASARLALADDPSTDPAPTDSKTEAEAKSEPKAIDLEVRTMSASLGESISVSGRGVAEDFLVIPSGVDVGAQLRSINADGGIGMGGIKLTDVALFDLQAQWAIAKHMELDGSASLLPKQPSTTSESIFQGGGLALRREVKPGTALAIAGSASPLLGMKGMATGGSLFVTHKHRLNEIVSFTLAAGASSTYLRPTGAMDHPLVVEAAGHASVLARVPECGCYGAWLGVGYAVPAYHHGHDPVGGMLLDPQPRLDIDIGNSVKLADQWDFSIELSIIDRGDLANPATRLPILDGGFDQIQIMVGVTRRLDFADKHHGISDPLIIL
jgi:hypothetical protein